jgi:predicted RND superfamily exporter protein
VLWNAGHFKSDVVTLGQLIDLLKEEKKNKDSIIYSQFEQTSISKLLNMLDNDKYSRIVFTMDCGVAEEQAFEVSHKVREYLQTNYSDKEIYFVGESIVYYDIRETYNNDAKIINIISLFSILALVLIAFKSISIPVLLVLIVQGAIWINFSINTIANDQLFFITYLVVMCIQMGATIDYGILMTSQYIDNRKTMDKYDALQRTLYTSLPTIFSSGSILIIAPLLVGALSNIAIISEIGFLLCRGCLVSVFLIVLALPQILLLCDKLIEKTSLKTTFFKEEELIEDVELEEEIKEHKESLQDV